MEKWRSRPGEEGRLPFSGSERLLHVLIARGTFVVAEYTPSAGFAAKDLSQDDDLGDMCRQVLIRMPRREAVGNAGGRRVYVYGSYTFCYMIDNDLTYMCVASQRAGSELPFKLISDLKRQSKVALTGGFGADSETLRLTQILKKCVDRLNHSEAVHSADARRGDHHHARSARQSGSGGEAADYVDELRRFEGGGNGRVRDMELGLEKTADVMRKNIEKVMTRGERIETLMGRTAALDTDMKVFRASSRQLKHKLLWASWRNFLLLGLVVLLLVVGVLMYAKTLAMPFAFLLKMLRRSG